MTISKKYQTGFTLVELLVALAVSMFVLMAVLGIFNSSSLSYNVQEDVAAVQQDIRVGKMFVERDVRMAGAGLTEYPPLANLADDATIGITFKNGFGVNNSDEITIRYITPVPDKCGDPPAGAGSDDVSCASLPPLATAPQNANSDDPMPVTSSSANIDTDMNDTGWDGDCYCGGTIYELTNNSNASEMPGIIFHKDNAGNILKAEKIYISKVSPSAGKLGNNPEIDYSNKVANQYPTGSTIMFFEFEPIEFVRYWIDADGVLWRDYDEDLGDNGGVPNPRSDQIVEHIEDLQFAFGLDTDDDGQVDTWRDGSSDLVQVTDADTGETWWDLSDDDKDLVRTVRISVLGRTDKARKELSPKAKPALEDHAAATDGDYFRRRLSQVEVELRNVAIATN